MSPVRTAELPHRRLALLGLVSSLSAVPIRPELPNPSAREVPVPMPPVVHLPGLPTASLPTKPPSSGKRR